MRKSLLSFHKIGYVAEAGAIKLSEEDLEKIDGGGKIHRPGSLWQYKWKKSKR